MTDQSLDDLELELRRLPGVRAAGFDDRDDLLLVQLHVAPTGGSPNLPVQATRVAARHSDRPVAVEVVRWREPSAPTPPAAVDEIDVDASPVGEIVLSGDDGTVSEGRRARLLAVLSFPDTDEIETHLVLGGRRTIGRAAASAGLAAVVDATVDALQGLGAPFAPKARWARPLDGAEEGTTLIAVALESDEDTYYGLARGSSPLEATARATLDALNRRLSVVL